MDKKILITGAAGFIGRHFLQGLSVKKGVEIHALIRPATKLSGFDKLGSNMIFHQIDLADIPQLKLFLQNNSFDIIFHIGALRGGRRFAKQVFFDANVNATEQIALSAQRNDSTLIFCSSVGVFGAIPLELPANNFTRRQEDNYYHFTKIRAEAIIQKLVLYGLKAAIIRPAITHGIGDHGFPFSLIKLVDKKLMFLPPHDVIIHLTNVEYLAEVFLKFIDLDFVPGSAYNVADAEPVKLLDLVNFINLELRKKDYPKHRIIPAKYFAAGEKIARFFHNELWIARFELISKSWYYDITDARKDLAVKPPSTIPAIKKLIGWYKDR